MKNAIESHVSLQVYICSNKIKKAKSHFNFSHLFYKQYSLSRQTYWLIVLRINALGLQLLREKNLQTAHFI